MKKTISTICFLAFTSIIISCNGQTKSKDHSSKSKTVSSEETKGTNPKTSYKVNKQYDAKGNLIKYDSTYSYFYSSRGKDSSKVILDSVYSHFKSFYSSKISNEMDKRFRDLFLNDSLFKYDFLNEDYFKKRFELNMQSMNKMFNEMDEIKTSFLKSPANENSSKKSIKK